MNDMKNDHGFKVGDRVITPDGAGRVTQILNFYPNTKALVHVDGKTPAKQFLLAEIEKEKA